MNRTDVVLQTRTVYVLPTDNCVSFERLTLQIPSDNYRFNYIKTKVRIHRYADRSLALFYGPRKLATYDRQGQVIDSIKKAENQ